MATVTIRIMDESPERYTLRPNSLCLGRMYDNIAEGLVVLFPQYEIDNQSVCTMNVFANGEQIDSIVVNNGVSTDIKDNLSQYKNITIGFMFENANGYVKNSEAKIFYFADAIKPKPFTPATPTQQEQINLLIGDAFTDVGWSQSSRNTLEFTNINGAVVKSIELSPFVQEQADLAEGDPTAETYVKNKYTRYLINDGEDGTSPYVTQDYVTNVDNLANYSPTSAFGDVAFSNDYASLYSIPKINNVALIGDLIASDLGLQNIILDLNAIRSGALLGTTSLQPNSKTSLLQNDGDGTSPYATQSQIGNGIITINQGGVFKGNFSTNQDGNTTINLDEGGGGSNDYTTLSNLPKINNTTLLGNLTASELALATSAQGSLAETALQPSDVDSALDVTSENPVQNKVLAQIIPSGASSQNLLATEDFVNSSIATNTAYFIGTFENVSALEAYSGTITNNDYAFVTNSIVKDNGNDFANFAALDAYDKTLLTNFDYAWVINGTKFDLYRFNIVTQTWILRAENVDKDGGLLNAAYNRYKATVVGSSVSWDYEYTLNNSSFTAAQWATINSGMTAADKTKLDGIEAGAQVNPVFETSTTNIKMDGTASVGSLDTIARADHVHPSDTSKQDVLVSGTNIKTLNGNSILGSGDLPISTYQVFPNSWTTNGTIAQLMEDIENDTNAVKGMAYLGEVTCSDLPFTGNADVVIEIMDGSGTSKVIVATINSGDVSPYYWRYTYWVISGTVYTSGWKSFVPLERTIAGIGLQNNITTASLQSALSDTTHRFVADSDIATWNTKLAAIANNFSESSTYSVGDIVYYGDNLYACSSAITTPGAWDSTKWTATSLEALLALKANANNVLTLDSSPNTFTSSYKQLYLGDDHTISFTSGSASTSPNYQNLITLAPGSSNSSPYIQVHQGTYNGRPSFTLSTDSNNVKLRIRNRTYLFPQSSNYDSYTVAVLENICPVFSTSSTYAVGDIVYYVDTLYKCTTAVTTAGAWNSANWAQTTVAQMIDDTVGNINTLLTNLNSGTGV